GKARPELLPTAANIKKQVDRLLAQPGDVAVIGLFGHGVQVRRGPAFCPADADLNDPARLIWLADLTTCLQRAPYLHKLLLADICRNDPRRASTPLPPIEHIPSPTEPIGERRPRSLTILTASSPGQHAYECPRCKQGVFSGFVAQGLRGRADVNRDGKVT